MSALLRAPRAMPRASTPAPSSPSAAMAGCSPASTASFPTAARAMPERAGPGSLGSSLKRRPDFWSKASASVEGLRSRTCAASISAEAALQKPLKSLPPRSGEVEAVEVHHLGPRRHEVLHKLLLRVRARVDFAEGAQLGVRTEDQVDARAGPLEPFRLAVAPLVHAFRAGGLPLCAHVEQVDEEVVR